MVIDEEDGWYYSTETMELYPTELEAMMADEDAEKEDDD